MTATALLVEDGCKRTTLRREVTPSEKLRSWILHRGRRLRIRLTDISLGGVGGVSIDNAKDAHFSVGDEVDILFIQGDDRYQVAGVLVHLGRVPETRRPYYQFGIKLNRRFLTALPDYQRALGQPLIQCRTYIRPQLTCDDPFYFLEHLYFQVNGFTAAGIDVVSSIRNSSLLPGQILNLELTVPGRGTFAVQIKVADFAFKANAKRLHFFLEYVNPERRMLDAVSEYLILFAGNVSPRGLRKTGFVIGNLSRAVQVVQQPLTTRSILEEGLTKGVLGVPTITMPDFNEEPFREVSVGLLCKLGPLPVARCELLMVDQDLSQSKLSNLGHQLPTRIAGKGHVEITNFLVSPHALLSDYFMHFLQHAVRISSQKYKNYLVLEAAQQLAPVLGRLGFRASGSSVRRSGRDDRLIVYELFDVKVENVLRNLDERVDPSIWNRVYRQLNDFLAKPSPYEGNQARPYFINQSELNLPTKK